MICPEFEYHNFIDFCEEHNTEKDIVAIHPPMEGNLPAPSFTALYKNYPGLRFAFSIAGLHPECKNNIKLEWMLYTGEILVNRNIEPLGAPLTVGVELPKFKDNIRLFVTLHYDMTVPREYCGVSVLGLGGTRDTSIAEEYIGSAEVSHVEGANNTDESVFVDLQIEISKLRSELANNDERNRLLQAELNSILASRSWRFAESLKRLKGIISGKRN